VVLVRSEVANGEKCVSPKDRITAVRVGKNDVKAALPIRLTVSKNAAMTSTAGGKLYLDRLSIVLGMGAILGFTHVSVRSIMSMYCSWGKLYIRSALLSRPLALKRPTLILVPLS
jgi:hypothetical protein